MPIYPRETPLAIGPVDDLWSLETPGKLVLRITRGDAFRMVVRLFESVEASGCGSRGVSPQTLVDLEARCTIRPSPSHALYTEVECQVDDAVGSGRITLSLTPEVTRTLYDWGGTVDLELSDGSDLLRKTIAIGRVEFLQDVSSQ